MSHTSSTKSLGHSAITIDVWFITAAESHLGSTYYPCFRAVELPVTLKSSLVADEASKYMFLYFPTTGVRPLLIQPLTIWFVYIQKKRTDLLFSTWASPEARSAKREARSAKREARSAKQPMYIFFFIVYIYYYTFIVTIKI